MMSRIFVTQGYCVKTQITSNKHKRKNQTENNNTRDLTAKQKSTKQKIEMKRATDYRKTKLHLYLNRLRLTNGWY